MIFTPVIMLYGPTITAERNNVYGKLRTHSDKIK